MHALLNIAVRAARAGGRQRRRSDCAARCSRAPAAAGRERVIDPRCRRGRRGGRRATTATAVGFDVTAYDDVGGADTQALFVTVLAGSPVGAIADSDGSVAVSSSAAVVAEIVAAEIISCRWQRRWNEDIIWCPRSCAG